MAELQVDKTEMSLIVMGLSSLVDAWLTGDGKAARVRLARKLSAAWADPPPSAAREAAEVGDPFVREVGRLEDGQGRALIVGVDHDAVTLHLGGGGAVELGMGQQEELGQLLIAAVWQAGWQRMKIDADTDRLAAQGGAP